MPKKKKTKENDPHEGRPSGLTFGDFLVSKAETAQKESASSNQDVPILSCATEELPEIDEKDQANTVTVFYVCRTKKGGVPVKVESRSSGKKVTVIEHVLGDGKKLLQELKSKFGTGGIFNDDNIELQGDCKTKLMKYFGDNKHLLKPYGSKI